MNSGDELPMTRSLEQHCSDFSQYMIGVLLPALGDVEFHVRSKTLRLHQAFSANFFVAHAVDYLHAIRRADGIEGGRRDLVRKFDQLFEIGGRRLSNRKFELIDAVNNALKHIRLDSRMYRDVEGRYGPISFTCLVQDAGKVLCMLDGYRFDYARVVLLPAIAALRSANLGTSKDIVAFARGQINSAGDQLMSHAEIVGDLDADDPSDAIDRMIEYCSPPCRECGEYEEDCSCATYVFEGAVARFEPMFNPSFDFDRVMSQISGAYKP